MRKTSIFFLIMGALFGFLFGAKSMEQMIKDGNLEDEDEPDPGTACKPDLNLV